MSRGYWHGTCFTTKGRLRAHDLWGEGFYNLLEDADGRCELLIEELKKKAGEL